MSQNIKMNQPKNSSTSFTYLILFVLILSGLYFIFNTQNPTPQEISLTKLTEEISKGNIAALQVQENRVIIKYITGEEQFAYKEPNQTLDDILISIPDYQLKNIERRVIPADNSQFWTTIIINVVLPFILFTFFILFMMRQAQNSNNQALSFGKSKARLYENTKKSTVFDDVAGANEAKEELLEIVDFLKNPGKYVSMGAKIPKGVLLVGPPGTGKTLLARAVAGEANVPFFSISGSEFVEMFVGVGASRVRDLFKKAQKNSPCIIFIDEIDAVGRQRGAGLGGGHDEREQTLNQILTEMDGFEGETGVIVMAATNRPDVLDPALLRPGRFDRRVMVNLPDIKDREAILNVHARNKPLEKTVKINTIAQHTPGFSGADLENLMNEAAILAAKQNRKTINQHDLQSSVEKVMMGPEKKSRGLSEKEKEITAYHETGHAIVGHLLPNCDPVHKISIISRGMALGVTWFLPEDDQHLYKRSKFLDEICSLLGGYVAEKIFFGEMTTGSSNDIQKATNIATNMITQYGMSSLGPITLGEKQHEVFLGRDFGHTKNFSEKTAQLIDQEKEKILREAEEITTKILTENKELTEFIAKKLLIKESLTRDEFLQTIAEFKGETFESTTENSEKNTTKTKKTKKN